jgi:hypothetical protein
LGEDGLKPGWIKGENIFVLAFNPASADILIAAISGGPDVNSPC